MHAVHLGPMSTAHTTIEPDSGRNWKVKYMPTEVGVYTINLAFNDIEVDGKYSSCFKQHDQALTYGRHHHYVIIALGVQCLCCCPG